ncbi:methyltransferase family protein [Legionella resiliens]|uniref:Isoprenylcysteine carboxylmethyltransferase family protein n=1 Tax=Legionella resiliens TaxID=2905958 RepID=A0ABS8X4Z2_9GAMM|nr:MULTISPECIES: isoprenylcysteine carboxylmethyltransferase family protein [unclassified Legionella]MCE0723269.1 isoprenylcysteine carboxylmethyltransferase family protein [Legionella sp. 9fVS26]MCE3532422.1 isoprenylcysteine carboxylmethyltransferase family protein [Legionella sp. 8cVS16]
MDKYVAIQAGISLVILVLTPFARFHSLALQTIGFLLFIIGFLIFILAVKQLGVAFTPVVTPIENARLVTSGIYGMVRHPIYTGLISLAIGWSVFWGSPLSFIASLGLIIFFHFKSNKEETLLSKKYPEYAQYKTKVKRKIIPFIY